MVTKLDDPKWPLMASRRGFEWAEMTDRDKVNFVCVIEYNAERQRLIDADPAVTEFIGRIAEADTVQQPVLDRLQAMKDQLCVDLKPVAERERELISALNIPLDPPELVQNPNDGTYDVMFDGASHLHISRAELEEDPDTVREKIKAKLAELETQR